MNMNRGAVALRAVGSVRQIAEALGLKSPSQVHRWCTGQEVPSEKRREQIAARWPAVRVELWTQSLDEAPGEDAGRRAEETPARVEVVPVEALAPPVKAAAPRAEETPARVEAAPVEGFDGPAARWLVEVAPRVEVPASERRAVLVEAEAQVDRLRTMQLDAARTDAALSVRVAIERELRAALAQLAEMRGELTPSDEAKILGSKAWERIVGELVRAVRELPERCTRGEVAVALARALDSADAGSPG